MSVSDLTPWGNRVLDKLEGGAAEALRLYLRRVEVTHGQVLVEQGAPVTVTHFPVTADLGNFMLLEDGTGVEVSSVGRDALSGLAAFLADEPIGWQVRVRVAGECWAIETDRLRALYRVREDMRILFLSVTHDNQIEAAQTAACNVHHPATARLAKWLLILHDRTQRSELRVTQQDLAAMLGIQRTTINEAAQALRASGAIRSIRGRVQITDLPALKAFACPCYAALKARQQVIFG